MIELIGQFQHWVKIYAGILLIGSGPGQEQRSNWATWLHNTTLGAAVMVWWAELVAGADPLVGATVQAVATTTADPAALADGAEMMAVAMKPLAASTSAFFSVSRFRSSSNFCSFCNQEGRRFEASRQCDKMWRNLAICVTFSSLAKIIWRFFPVRQNFGWVLATLIVWANYLFSNLAKFGPDHHITLPG